MKINTKNKKINKEDTGIHIHNTTVFIETQKLSVDNKQRHRSQYV